eukprot:scaffold699_cov231-Pinguiococcus_pyrenoidosus.AAC.6
MDFVHQFPNGRSVALLNPSEAGGLSRTTGWTTWDSAHILLDYLSRNEVLQDAAVADISTGNGFVALSCAALGASRVIATEVSRCVELTKQNVALNLERAGAEASWAQNVQVLELQWGDQLAPELRECSTALICDALFIAIRDGIEAELLDTITQLCQAGLKVLFIYEERVVTQERDFIDGAKAQLLWEEIPPESLDLNAALGKDDSDGEADVVPDLFYEPPAVRLWSVVERRDSETTQRP